MNQHRVGVFDEGWVAFSDSRLTIGWLGPDGWYISLPGGPTASLLKWL